MTRPQTFTFVVHFFRYAAYLRALLFLLLGMGFCGAITIAFVEDIGVFEAIYFSCITGLSIGYGDIAPSTSIGRGVSVLIGFIGLIFNGLIVATATRALRDMVTPDSTP